MTASPLGGDVWYTRTQQYAWYALTPVTTWQTYLRCVIDAVTHREPVYFHCTAGADRTGTLACVLEGLLGMSQSDIDKDYELTTFYSGSGSDATARQRSLTSSTPSASLRTRGSAPPAARTGRRVVMQQSEPMKMRQA